MLTVLGILLFVVGLAFSIWFHELGHFFWARRFGMRVTQFMVGFGPTLWSRRIHETEHGLKAVPLGGYIRIVGMIPPGPEGKPSRSYGRMRRLVEEVRGASMQDVRPDDGDRVFYRKPWWQRIIVMSAGPAHNLVLAFVIFTILLVGLGTPVVNHTVAQVNDCVIPATAAKTVTDCSTPIDGKLPAASPASQAGFLPGDTIVAVNGKAIDSWDQVRNLIRDSAGQELSVRIDRAGRQQTLTVTPLANQVLADDGSGRIVTVGFLGLAAGHDYVQQPVSAVPGQVGSFISLSAQKLVQIPERIPQLFRAAFLGEQRDVNGPIGIVGVGRISGEVFALPGDSTPLRQKIAFFLSLLASLNMVLFLFNLVPIYPLDGGHVAGALWEKGRSVVARVRRRPDPGPFDTARLMPVAYVVASLFVVLSGLLLVADVVNPITLPQ